MAGVGASIASALTTGVAAFGVAAGVVGVAGTTGCMFATGAPKNHTSTDARSA